MNKGDLAPDFTLLDDHGDERKLAEFLESGPVVLFFYPAAMSGGCTVEGCHFRDLTTEFEKVGARRVGISPDSVTEQRRFAVTNAFDYPLLSDEGGEVAKQFGVYRRFSPLHTKRHTFVIDTDRTIIEVVKSELRFVVHADRALKVLHARKAA
jgi:peroxiredoxin Q/BCP